LSGLSGFRVEMLKKVLDFKSWLVMVRVLWYKMPPAEMADKYRTHFIELIRVPLL
jgi:hypothetical protein